MSKKKKLLYSTTTVAIRPNTFTIPVTFDIEE